MSPNTDKRRLLMKSITGDMSGTGKMHLVRPPASGASTVVRDELRNKVKDNAIDLNC